MVIYVSRNILGVYAVDEGGKLRAHIPFTRDPSEVADRLHSIASGELVEEEKALLKKVKPKKGEELYFDTKKEGYQIERPNPATRYIFKNEAELVRSGDVDDIIAFKNAVALNLVRFAMHEGVGRDRLATNAIEALDVLDKSLNLLSEHIEALDVLDKSLNLLSERIREWYGVHFPELDQEVTDHERFVSLVLAGERDVVAQSSGDPTIVEYAGRSLGIKLAEADVTAVSGFAASLRELYTQRDAIGNYLDALMTELAPNVRTVAGANLGARIISISGGLERLARMPSSTVQILGAERALFKHLAKGSPSPKHGVIFQHPAIGHAPPKLRGKVARALAAKISLAAKMDFYSHEDHGEELKTALDEKVERIKAQGKAQGGGA